MVEYKDGIRKRNEGDRSVKFANRFPVSTFNFTILALACALSVSCGGASVLKEPQQIQSSKPLAGATNAEISVNLDWIIVPNGPGAWAKDAYWDEYLVSVRNHTSQALVISDIAIYDSKGHRSSPRSNRKKLIKESKKTVRRYKDLDIAVRPGMGAGKLLAASGAVTVTGVGIVYAAATAAPMGGAGGAAALGVGMAIAGPIIAVASVVQASQNSEVNNEIKRRRTELPIKLEPNESVNLDVFFPIAPSPSHLDVHYQIGESANQLRIHTQRELAGLHLESGADDGSGIEADNEKQR